MYVESCVEQQQGQQMSQHAAAAAVAAAAAAAQQQFAGQMQHGYPQVPQGLVHQKLRTLRPHTLGAYYLEALCTRSVVP